MKYSEIVEFLENQLQSHDIDYLKNAFALLNLTINPEQVILVAGTNGKGTTCATLSTLLVEYGKKVGFFSSPHLKKTTERIKFNNQDISEEDFCEAFDWIHGKIGNLKLSHFEWLTFMAAYYFFEVKKIDFAIFEIGLGGTYDSTNIIPHKYCVITHLAEDHKDILGNNILEIAKNKFGIISEQSIVFHAKFDSEILRLLNEYSKKLKSKLIESCEFELKVKQTENNYPIFFVKTIFGEFKMNLPGKRAAENSALALTVFDYITGRKANEFGSAIGKVNWSCRMQKIIYKNRDIFLSGDHNPDGIQSLLEILRYYRFEKVHFIVGICRDKEYSKMLDMLLSYSNANLYLTETTMKILKINEYDEKHLKAAKYADANQIAVLNKAIENASEKDLIIVTGSLYLSGKILSEIEK